MNTAQEAEEMRQRIALAQQDFMAEMNFLMGMASVNAMLRLAKANAELKAFKESVFAAPERVNEGEGTSRPF